MNLRGLFLGGGLVALAGLVLVLPAQNTSEQLLRLRTLGKAYYENPTTQAQAVEQFRQAVKLNPGSTMDRLNFALSLLRAGKGAEGMAELQAVQKLDPKIPHTWFNLGIEYKKMGESEKAIAQLEQMAKMVPGEPITEYNLGVLYKAMGRLDDANRKFELSAQLDPNFAAPHFQLFNYYRQQSEPAKAKTELGRFQALKKVHDDAGTGNEDVEWSLYSEILDPVDGALATGAPVPGALKFSATTLPGKFAPAGASLQVIDADGTGSTDLLVVADGGLALFRKGLTPVPQPALSGLHGVLAAVPGDYNNDGLMDLCVLTKTGAVLLENSKTGFKKGLELPPGRYESALWVDYDHDYDLDLVLLGAQTKLLRNQIPGGFEDHTAELPFASGTAVAGVEVRVIPDTKSHDMIVSYADRKSVLYKDRLAGQYAARDLDALPQAATGLVVADLNNDSELDLVWNGGAALNHAGTFEAISTWPARGGFALGDFENRGLLDTLAAGAAYRNRGQSKFTTQEKPVGLPADAVTFASADFDGDGLVDAAALLPDGTVQRLINQTATKSGWTRVALTGVKNLKLAAGTEVEVKAGALYQKQMYRGYPLSLGVRGTKEVDTIRITWPNGMIQNEMKQKAGAALKFEEAQRLSGSCPTIWTWNGTEFEFITDTLGVAPLGASSGDGKYFPVDHDEFLSIRGDQLKAVNGQYEVRITEELSEVTYLDQVKLIALDHPASQEVFTNDKWKSPPFPDFRLFGVTNRVYPNKATEDGQRDVTSAVLKRDGRYPDGFRRDLQNVAAMHTLELDFGQATKDNRAVLIMSGWVDWADGSTFRGESQRTPAGLVTPQLQVRDKTGQWVTVIEDMGMPAGKPKTIAVDLTGKFLGNSREVRIVTNLCLYWDEIFLSETNAAPQVRMTELAAGQTDLHFRGFSKNVVDPERKQPERFFYANPAVTSNWNPTPGLYTRYGAVTPLLREVDDKLVVMGSGDEVQLKFDGQALPALPSGWRRDWLLKVDGWAKDRDANTAYSQTVEPLPFHGMSAYPYPAGQHYPDSAEYRDYQKLYNTRPALRLLRALHESGTRSRQVN
ncbi:FG-GAP-like repeat-containing protein [uncultured Paludibaculum sp.]|uniref:FG-GAP-like repeat-containing protein n=1 Tax=uncultured Paludibaculum sp. TaxID=1765020 RepID=UPI002AAA7D69|nr:FG-GAP-like repeat-containing protein [uncultured Paludibaculum sp.]